MEAPVTAKVALLQALMSGPAYGLQLIERVKARSHGGLKLGQGSVYPALRALEDERLVKRDDSPSTPKHAAGGRSRIVYELTAEGLLRAQQNRRVAAALFRVAGALEF